MNNPDTRPLPERDQTLDIILHEPGFARMFMVLGYFGLLTGMLITLFNLSTPGVGLKPGGILLMAQALATLAFTRRGKLKWAAVLICWIGIVAILPSAYTTLGLLSLSWALAPLLILCGSWLLSKRMGYWLAFVAASMALFFYGLHKTGHVFTHVYPPENMLMIMLSVVFVATLIGRTGSDAFQRKFDQLRESRHKLARSEMQLFALFDSTEDLIWSVEPDTFRLVKFNAAFAAYFGQEGAVRIEANMSPTELLADRPRASHWEALYRRALDTGRYSIEDSPGQDGQTFLLTFNPIGEGMGIAVFARNITEQLQLEAVRENEYAFQNQLIESIPGIFYVFDADGRFLMWNKNLLDLLGVTAHELARYRVPDFIPLDQQVRVGQAIDHVFSTGNSVVEADILSGTGNAIPHLLTGYRLDWHGQLSLLGIGLDISERKAAEQALTRYQTELEQQVETRTRELTLAKQQADSANQAKGSFLANMSHEIRTPLTAIVGFSESLLQDTLSDAEREQATRTVIRNGQHLLGLISDILDFSKIEAGHLEIEPTTFDLADFLADLQALAQAQAQARQITFSLHLLSPLPVSIRTDVTRARQILINLLGNAVKFTPANGRVRLIVSYDPATALLLFTVQDTGIGIEQDAARELFKPFVQADVSTTRRFGGTGLGLSISRELARLLGGDIRIFSIKSLGSLFMVSLSAGQPDAIRLTDQPAEALKRATTSERTVMIPRLSGHILVAEDTPDTQQLISLLLRRTGVRFTVVSNGQEALGAIQVAEFDLLLIDMQMPVMGGLEACSLIRLTGFAEPVIALTANATEADKAEARAAGCDDFLTKPIDQATFYATLERYLPTSHERLQRLIQPAQHNLQDDPEYQALKAAFLQELPERLSSIGAAATAQDWAGLSSQLHQLKGIAGSYGFPDISRLTGQMEQRLRDGDYRQVSTDLTELDRLGIR